MKWRKMGLVYCPPGDVPWASSHAMIPTPVFLGESAIRVYVGFRDPAGVGRVGYVDVDAADPSRVLAVSKCPALDIGEPGAFDDNGVLPTCVVDIGGALRLYYVGFQIGVKVRYFMLSGAAESTDGGLTFRRCSRVPVLERSDSDLFFRTAPFVTPHENIWKMWYVGGDSWTEVDGKKVPIYRIKYVESDDGMTWPGDGKVCFEMEGEDEYGFGRPYVLHRNDHYQMTYSIRTRSSGYRLGYSESTDGTTWARMDSQTGIDVSNSGWDSQMICYSSIIASGGKTYMFYNGNNFGGSGFGYAVLEDN